MKSTRAGRAPHKHPSERNWTELGCLLVLLLTVSCGGGGAAPPAQAPERIYGLLDGLAPSPLPIVQLGGGDRLREQQLGLSPSTPSAAIYRGRYTFSQDWFSYSIPVWVEAFAPYKGRPGLRYLEVGAFEGRSVLWVLENIMTDPGARATVIDLFEGDLKGRFLTNVSRSGEGHKVTLIVGYSQVELRKLPVDSYDVAYIDGSHTADDVLEDAVLTWRLLKAGGLLIFDDYAWGHKIQPDANRPGPGIVAFYTFYGRHFDVLHVGWQVILRKRSAGAAS